MFICPFICPFFYSSCAATSCSKRDHVYSVTHSVLFKERSCLFSYAQRTVQVISIQRRTVSVNSSLFTGASLNDQPLACIVGGGGMKETIQEQSELELPNQNGLCRCGSHGLSMFSKCGWPTWQSCLTYSIRQGHGGSNDCLLCFS